VTALILLCLSVSGSANKLLLRNIMQKYQFKIQCKGAISRASKITDHFAKTRQNALDEPDLTKLGHSHVFN